MDVFRALSFDRLHTNHEGLGGKHLWSELQKLINEIGRDAASKIDERFVNCVTSSLMSAIHYGFFRFADAPRWRNLNHFKEVMGISFADGTKYEDILKVRGSRDSN